MLKPFCFVFSICLILRFVSTNLTISIEKPLVFPELFIFSTATASYQIEGGWNASGKGENVWDRMVHTNPSFVKDGSNGDVACDSFHKFYDDVLMIKDLGFKMYRFSISWSRILPDGTTRYINQAGIDYYYDLINRLLKEGIEPMVTLHHWDVPQPLQDYGGWLNESMVQYFVDYADVVFYQLGDKVKWWITINEPKSLTSAYGAEDFAPALNLHGTGEYLAGHNIIKAHAKAYRLYHAKYGYHRGKVSLSANGDACYPKTEGNEEDEKASERLFQFQFGWFLHPILSSEGDYPPIMRKIVDENSRKEGRNSSRLPYFTTEELVEIKGSMDYLGLNHYTSVLATQGLVGANPSWSLDTRVRSSFDENWPPSQSSWLKVVPEGIRKIVNDIKKSYGNIPIFITENGFSDYNETQDYHRIKYYKRYLKQLNAAINEDGCNVIGYTVWSLMDNFEWRAGYSERFGLVQVDFSDENRPRKYKKSARFFKENLRDNTLFI